MGYQKAQNFKLISKMLTRRQNKLQKNLQTKEVSKSLKLEKLKI